MIVNTRLWHWYLMSPTLGGLGVFAPGDLWDLVDRGMFARGDLWDVGDRGRFAGGDLWDINNVDR